MADPVRVTLNANQWTQVAANVVSGVITIQEWQPSRYYQTYRMTGNPAPTGDQNEATSVITVGQEISIAALAAIDVYLFCRDQDGAVVVAL
jgi:hypothetical protein